MTAGTARDDLLDRLAAGDVLPTVASDTGPDSAGLLAHPAARVLNAFNRRNAEVVSSTPDHLGPYRLLHPIGSGGMGEVWLGERSDGIVERQVAIKRVRRDMPMLGPRLEQERHLLVRLSHPNIAAFIDAGIDAGGTPWLAMEYVAGIPLHQWCDQHHASLTERLKILRKLALAVAHAHQQLIVHRDIKPTNILVDRQGEPKLLDFGIGKWLDEVPGEVTQHVMTPAYAAPEQLCGQAVSTATDIYALGLLMFRILAGSLPSTRLDSRAASIASQIDREESERPSHVALTQQATLPYPAKVLKGDLDAIIGQAIRLDPKLRYVSAFALAEDIERYLNQEPVQARGNLLRYRLGRLVARNKTVTALTLSTVMSLLGGSYLFWQQSERAEQEAQLARQQAEESEQLAGFLTSMFNEQVPLTRAGERTLSPGEMLANGVQRVTTELKGSPTVQARLLAVLAEGQYHLGELEQAQYTVTSALSSTDEDPENAVALARLYAVQGLIAKDRFQIAESHTAFARALAFANTADQGDGLETARVNMHRIRTLLLQSQLADAESLARTTYERVLTLRGASAPESLELLQLLGSALDQQRKDVEALGILQQLISLIEQHRGQTDVRLIPALVMRAGIEKRSAHPELAEQDVRRAISLGQLQLGKRHSLLSRAYILLATLLIEREETDAAITELGHALQATPDSDLPSLAQIYMSRGEAQIDRDPVKAEQDLREALHLRLSAGAQSSGLAWYTQAVLGRTLAYQGRFAEAEALQLEAADKLRAILGPDAYQNALIAHQQSFVSARKGDWATSARQVREALRIARLKYPDTHPVVFQYQLQLLDRLSHLPEARIEARALADTLLEHWSERAEVSGSLAELSVSAALLHQQLGDQSRARAIAQQALNHPDWPIQPATRQKLQQLLQ